MGAAEVVAAIDAAILALVEGGVVQRYVVGGKDVSKYSLVELRELRREYAALAAKESGRGGKMRYVQVVREVE